VIVFFALIAVALAQYHQNQYQHQEEEHYAPAKYDFYYDVHDEKTGDIKYQKESRDGYKVVGEYSLVDPDGHRRTVTYSSDKDTGFVAHVQREEIKGYQAPVYYKEASKGYSGYQGNNYHY
jgi:Insect cuticle protein